MDVTGKFPIYEADQVLSAEHLNQSLSYLEKHDRISRRLLHGIGIVCGLEFTVEEGVLTITKGCGITSQGYLIALEEALILTKVRKYIPPYPPKYLPFYNGADKPFALWEAVPETEAEGDGLQKLSNLKLDDKALLLYLEAKEKDLKECVGDDCDNMGKVLEFTIRPLIISLEELATIFKKNAKSIEDISSEVFAYNLLQEIEPPRFDVLASKVETIIEINDEYATLSDELLKTLKSALLKTEEILAGALEMPTSMASKIEELKEMLASIKTQDLGQQYFYDHLCDIAAAYNELAATASQWLVQCMPDEDAFPRHLALGEFAELKANSPKIFRHYFIHTPSTPEAQNLRKQLVYLYKRLFKILSNFELKLENEVKVMRSTIGQPLSEKAIPYYYRPTDATDNSWLLGWNFEKHIRAAWSKNAHFYNAPQNQLQNDLEFYNFLRIEGHLGKAYTDALAGVQKQINDYRLPIKAIALAAGPVPLDPSLLEECNMKDLDADFERIRENLFCQMQDASCYFGSFSAKTVQLGSSTQKVVGEAKKAKETATESSAEEAYSDMSGMVNLINKNVTGISSIDRISIVIGTVETNFKKGQFISSRCQIKPDTIGAAYLDLLKKDDLKGKSLIDIYLPYLNLSNLSINGRIYYLVSLFPYLVIDELEELAGIATGASLSTLDFKMLKVFGEEFMAFLKLYIDEIEKLERQQEVPLPSILHDIKHKLVHLVSLCKLKEFFALYKIYRSRIKRALAELEFRRFITRHPGIDHKAGTTKGGTFILVYHTTTREEEEDLRIVESEKLAMETPGFLYDELKKANPTIKAASTAEMTSANNMTVSDANNWMLNNLYEYAKATGGQLTNAALEQFKVFLTDFTTNEQADVELPEGTVFADFYLPYLCCGDCGGIDITIKEPELTVSIALSEKRFCIGSKKPAEFIVSPPGGVVSGPGVETSGDKFVFNPAADDVSVGIATFTYTLQGKTAQTQASILAAPEADFAYGTDTGSNGTYVGFENKSRNAKSYLWDLGNGKTSTAENPETQFYDIGQETIVVTLTASNGVCDDVEAKTITLFTKEYEIDLGKGTTDFCGLDGEVAIRLSIVGVGFETFPFDGVVKGDGVIPPDENWQEYRFNPKNAGLGEHKLEYEVDGNIVASIVVNVFEPFDVAFSHIAERSRTGLNITFADIKPTDKSDYLWYMDETNPTNNVSRTDANKFSHFYPAADIADRNEITVRLLVRDAPCFIDHSETITIPQLGTVDNGEKTFDPVVVASDFKPIATTVSSSNFRSGTSAVIMASPTTNPFTLGTALLKELETTLKSAAKRKKLVSGSSNSTLAKSYSTVLTGVQDSFSQNRRSLTATQKTEVMEFYGKMATSLFTVVGILENDLKRSEALYKTMNSAGAGIKAMDSLGMSTKVKNGIKNKLTALSKLDKPVAGALATAINKSL